MLDFVTISKKTLTNGLIEIEPDFITFDISDLMTRGGNFYAIWDEDSKLWSTDESVACRLIDREVDEYVKANRNILGENVRVKHIRLASSGVIDKWHKYVKQERWEYYHSLDTRVLFSNNETKKEDYASKKLPYPLEDRPTPAYDEMMSVLYSPEERHKIEWAIGAIFTGEAKNIQKFIVMYGAPKTGKSTVLNIIEKLFKGYCGVFDAKSLGSSNSQFALESLSSNPLVAIQHDGDLSRIEDNTRLNSLIAHEKMPVNTKNKSIYTERFNTFLFMGTNNPVKISDAKSGIIRRLIDVTPTGDRIESSRYAVLYSQIDFELGGIANHCINVFRENPKFYDDYVPLTMISATNDFYNFIDDSYDTFKSQDAVSLKQAWTMYKEYVEYAKVTYPYPQRIFQEELKNYFREYRERTIVDDIRIRKYYIGFLSDKFTKNLEVKPTEARASEPLMIFDSTESIFDKEYADCPAQYATEQGTPSYKWENVQTRLRDISTTSMHYVKVPENHIVIDFDLKDKDGNKSFELNAKAAAKWPPTYGELSKSGQGIHLHYIYDGDVTKLCRIYDENIEIKVFKGKAALRRLLTKCNKLAIAVISSGLPLMKGSSMQSFDGYKSEKALRTSIIRNLKKDIHPATKPSIDFIYKILNDAYASDLKYDVSDMHSAILDFAMASTNNADYCVNLVSKMHFKSDDPQEAVESSDDENDIYFYDVEVFPNLFIVCWKKMGADNGVNKMINPTPAEIEMLLSKKLVGFNCRRYDNHILYAARMGYTCEQLYDLSRRIIGKEPNSFFGSAYNLSETDIFDFSSEKKSLKKFEIDLDIHHQELGIPWDKPVPENLWDTVAGYCCNDVVATEAVWNARKGDFLARKILADVAGMTINDTTNSLTTRIIFGREKRPNLIYTDLKTGKQYETGSTVPTPKTKNGDPFNAFPEYVFENAKNIFRRRVEATEEHALNKTDYFIEVSGQMVKLDISEGEAIPYSEYGTIYRYVDEDVGKGGYVYSIPGIYTDVALLDVASLHPHSATAMNVFGEFTKNFQELMDARIYIKHHEYDKAKQLLGGKLAKYLQDESDADALSKALKIAINSVYGLTAANFENPFRDKRNKNNIVALRGALFMITLQHLVEEKGYTVLHIKTDSIKIANADLDIIRFCMDFAQKYGYTFEHEATYDRICLIDKAQYIAKYATVERCTQLYGEEYLNSEKDICKENKKHGGDWTATGKEFQVPYVFKTLFSKEPLEFKDLCIVNEVQTAIYLDMNENLPQLDEREKKDLDILSDVFTNGLSDEDPNQEKIFTKYGGKVLAELRYHELLDKEAKAHNYIFVGKVGQFCPIKEGYGGGVLVREADGKYDAVAGSKGYRWLESETVRVLHKEDDIETGYFQDMASKALLEIEGYDGPDDGFIHDEHYEPLPF